MTPRSAGLLIYRRTMGVVEVLLVHPGGPYWRKRDVGAWQLPKGTIEPGEEPLVAAMREAEEELGTRFDGDPYPLGTIRQAGGKHVEAFALEHGFDTATIRSMMFEMEWPPRSGTMQSFPEVDAAQWFTIGDARDRMLASQQPFLDRLLDFLA